VVGACVAFYGHIMISHTMIHWCYSICHLLRSFSSHVLPSSGVLQSAARFPRFCRAAPGMAAGPLEVASGNSSTNRAAGPSWPHPGSPPEGGVDLWWLFHGKGTGQAKCLVVVHQVPPASSPKLPCL
jgi:hypothetical protein